MPYITTDKVKEIRNELKSQFPKFKFSVVRGDYSSVNVAVLNGPVDFGTEFERVNQYWIKDHWADRPEALEFLLKVNEIISRDVKEVSYDYDYGSLPNYYYSIQIGKWNKPYTNSKK